MNLIDQNGYFCKSLKLNLKLLVDNMVSKKFSLFSIGDSWYDFFFIKWSFICNLISI